MAGRIESVQEARSVVTVLYYIVIGAKPWGKGDGHRFLQKRTFFNLFD
jgi:hypothetical protein